jgi:hypothetical protein
VEPEEVEALIDVDDAGLLRRQPQPHWGENVCHLLPQRLGMPALPGHHHHEVVGIADELPVSEAVPFAFGPLLVGAHPLSALTLEVIIQHR